MKTNSIIIPSLAALALLGASAQAAVTATAVTGANNTFTVSTTDLADTSQGGSTSFTGTANYSSSAAKVIDGRIYNGFGTGNTEDTLTPSVGNTLTLNLATFALGWDISSIVVLTGVGNLQSGRSDHSYTIALSTDGTTFGTPFINVNNTTISAAGGGEVRMTIADNPSVPLGTGIKAVRFVFGNAWDYSENMYREIDVLGVASVPEPSGALLGGLGVLLLLRRRRA